MPFSGSGQVSKKGLRAFHDEVLCFFPHFQPWFPAGLEVRFRRKKLFLAFTLNGAVKWPVNECFRSTVISLFCHFFDFWFFNIYIYRYTAIRAIPNTLYAIRANRKSIIWKFFVFYSQVFWVFVENAFSPRKMDFLSKQAKKKIQKTPEGLFWPFCVLRH